MKVEEDPQGLLEEMEKIFRVMQAISVEGVNLTSYQLKDVAYQWYEEWYRDRDGVEESALWETFSKTFLDRFFPQELREAKMEEFVNLKQGRISVKEYALKFHQLSRYAPGLVSDMWARMRKFGFGLSRDLIL